MFSSICIQHLIGETSENLLGEVRESSNGGGIQPNHKAATAFKRENSWKKQSSYVG